MTTQIPHAIFLAMAANDQASALHYPPLRLFWYSKTAFEDGAEAVDMDGTEVRIYSPERTLPIASNTATRSEEMCVLRR